MFLARGPGTSRSEFALDLLGRRHLGHRVGVLGPGLGVVERRGQGEDGLAVLDRGHPAGGERPPVPGPVDHVDQRHGGVARPDEVGVQGVHRPVRRARSARRRPAPARPPARRTPAAAARPGCGRGRCPARSAPGRAARAGRPAPYSTRRPPFRPPAAAQPDVIEEPRPLPRRAAALAGRRRRAGDQERYRCWRALVTATYSSRLSSSIASGVLACTIGISPSTRPGSSTASHSSPLAACIEASVTPSDRGRVAQLGPLGQLGGEVAQAGLRPRGVHVVGQLGDGGQRLPALAGRRPPAGRAAGEADAGQHVPDRGRQRVRVRRPAAVAAGGAAEQHQRLADHRPLVEPLGAAHHVGHLGLGQRPLEPFGVGVDPDQHRDLAGRNARRDQRPDLHRHPGRLAGVVGVLGEHRAAGPGGRCATSAWPDRISWLATATTCGVDR